MNIIMVLALLVAASGAAAGPVTLAKDSRLWLEGTSTLHAFASTATALSLDMALERAEGETLEAAALAGRPARLTLRVPVAGLKSGHGGLDKNLREALKAAEFPDIAFVLDAYTVLPGTTAIRLELSGTLTVAGRARPVRLEAAVERRGGRLALSGEQALLMTDFGITPPKLMFGALKTGDKVSVKYRFELE